MPLANMVSRKGEKMMVESKIYECDGGSLLVGSESVTLRLPNGYGYGYGDGVFDVTVFDRSENKYQILPEGYEFVANIRGNNIIIYKYDCLYGEDLKRHKLFVLSGEYSVYRYKGNMYFEKRH